MDFPEIRILRSESKRSKRCTFLRDDLTFDVEIATSLAVSAGRFDLHSSTSSSVRHNPAATRPSRDNGEPSCRWTTADANAILQ